MEKPVTFTGIVTGIEFSQPACSGVSGRHRGRRQSREMALESGPPNQWQRGGLRKAMLAPGTMLKIRAYRAKDGTQNFAFLRDLTFLSGPQNGAASNCGSAAG